MGMGRIVPELKGCEIYYNSEALIMITNSLNSADFVIMVVLYRLSKKFT